MKKIKLLLLLAICVFYSFLFIATKPNVPCDDDCEKINAVDSRLRTTREGYIFAVGRCSYKRISDSLCVYVRDTTGINWNLLADTVCMIATENGLPPQKVLIMKVGTSPLDTLVKKQCP